MDRVFTIFILLTAIFGVVIYGIAYFQESSADYASPPQEEIPSPTTIRATTTSSSTSTSTTSTTTSMPTTSTTMPRYMLVEHDNLGKCSNTLIGKMNTLNVEVNGEDITGNWGVNAGPKWIYVCDGNEVEFDKSMFKGGRNIEALEKVEGEYRLMAKCGRNQLVDDLNDCLDLKVYLDTASVNMTSIDGTGVEEYAATDETITSTTTTLAENPYLEKFKGKGYRKADLDVAWMCPTCVPAVNKVFMNEPGVKSKSIGYRQDINYVIYDPGIIGLERIMRLANAGGTATLINDTDM
ncbi:MAG: hypothetical protein ABIH11_07840 [Candidatus Altiarchaeota archaeon]